ncbi:tigger transposable element-derived protein 1-like [Macrobrachium rosenbergii]|uniref:tigger transposable element-derived protein 1-like n=1 Tax=Macrobrachium rosenbergii TaxID=79674 RepID=UPI0034D58BC8
MLKVDLPVSPKIIVKLMDTEIQNTEEVEENHTIDDNDYVKGEEITPSPIIGTRANETRYVLENTCKTNTESGHALELNRTTVQSIVKDKECVVQKHMKDGASVQKHMKDGASVQKHMKDGASVMAVTPKATTTRLSKLHNPNLVEMERLLMVWLKDLNQRNVPVSLGLIQEKARESYEALVRKRGEGSGSAPFVASRGWFNRFKSRANLHSLKLQEEAASSDEEVTEGFPICLAEVIREAGYTADQVFNVNETGLFWKRMPGRTYISKEEKTAPGYKVSKERLTLLLGSNASGDFKLKPLLVYLAENPRALQGIFKPQLPVIWKGNKKAWVTVGIFEEWFNDHFLPAVEKYLKRKGLEFKVLLVLDSAPGHPTNLGEIYPNVKVVYLPPNTTSLLQPMDQGVIASFKAYYTRRTFCHVLRVIKNSSDKLSVKQVWENYSILDAVKNIEAAWNEVKKPNLNGAWKKLCPKFVMDFTGFEKGESLDAVTRKIVQYSKKLNLEVEAEDVNELLESHGEELSAEDLSELEKQMIEEEEEAPSPKPRALNAKSLSLALALFEQGLVIIEEQDPNVERFTKFQRVIQDALAFYEETYSTLHNPIILIIFIIAKEMSYPDSTAPDIVEVSPPTSLGLSHSPPSDDPPLLNDPLVSPALSDAGDFEQEEEEDEGPDTSETLSANENDPELELEPECEFEHEAEHDEPALELEPEGNLDAESEPEPERHSEPESRAKSISPPREDEPPQKEMSSYSSQRKDDESLEEKDFDLSHRQHSRDNTTVEDEDVAVKEEVEDEYYKMSYEDAPMQDMYEK